jgi:glycosyltransferase involved in cell wall biosynthesis
MKGVGDLVSAYRIVKKKIPNLKLWIAGGGDAYKDELMKDCANDPDVTFYGYIPDEEKIPLYSRAHLFASASVKEGFGIVVIEAGAHGTPAVVYNVDGFNEAVVDGETGILTDTNPEALAEGLHSILTDKVLYTKLQHGAYERSKEFNFDNTADVFEKILNTK